jgi:hydroxymethylpyrimidine/phosphomethylpyrimidine kinase
MSGVPATRRVLTIAGSDSGGGAGIQADLKAFARCGVHGMTAVTMITAQSTVSVDRVHAVPPEMIVAQIRSVAADIGIDAIKIGMLGDAETIAAVAGCLLQLPAGIPIVVDPVLVATSGARLLAPEALASLLRLIVPLATVLTPNLPEARALVAGAAAMSAAGAGSADAPTPPAAGAGSADASSPPPAMGALGGPDGAGDTGAQTCAGAGGEVAALARTLWGLGAANVVVTGGHRDERADLFFDGATATELSGPRHAGGATHGSGCTHSAVVAAQLALGVAPIEAARRARRIAAEAIAGGLRELGAGEGPVDVLAAWRKDGGPRSCRLP